MTPILDWGGAVVTSNPENTSVLEPPQVVAERDIEQVPFVELANNRLQGVVSSGSDIERVYCCFLEAGSLAYYSSTNNNRPDAGTAKRLRWLTEAAFAQFGREQVVRYLQLPVEAGSVTNPAELVDVVAQRGRLKAEPSGEIFSRFLNYLRHVELDCDSGPMPEMSWFVGL
jgi:hypothetical protein